MNPTGLNDTLKPFIRHLIGLDLSNGPLVLNFGRGINELMGGWWCAILALENIKILPKNLFYKILCLLF